MTEEQLRELQEAMNAEVNAKRSEGKYSEAQEIRQEVLRVQEAGDKKQLERYAEYDRIAADAEEASSAQIIAEAADAVSAAETIISGKG